MSSERDLEAAEKLKEGLAPVVQGHYNSLKEKGLDERCRSRIVHMRNFNNWTKSMLIREFVNQVREKGDCHITVLDIGAGKGGDLLKWKKGDISHLVCADIAETSLEHCKQRYAELRNRHNRQRERGNYFTAEFIHADCTKVQLKERYENPNIKFDIVSCQFTFHYCFESLDQANCMLQNIAECLRPGGYFIGTTPDSNDLIRRLKESPGLKFGNDVYHVEFENKDSFPLFGSKYMFHLEGVVDCPEFLVYFPIFKRLAKRHGLSFMYKKRFEEFFVEYEKDHEGRMLLQRMQALETYPPHDGQSPAGNESEDYENARSEIERIKEEKEKDRDGRPPRNICVGTLSKQEWEALSIYVVFAFQKD